MAENTNPQYPAGVYVKDGKPARVARTAGEAVQAVFEGFRLSESAAEPTETANASEATPEKPAPKPTAPKRAAEPDQS